MHRRLSPGGLTQWHVNVSHISPIPKAGSQHQKRYTHEKLVVRWQTLHERNIGLSKFTCIICCRVVKSAKQHDNLASSKACRWQRNEEAHMYVRSRIFSMTARPCSWSVKEHYYKNVPDNRKWNVWHAGDQTRSTSRALDRFSVVQTRRNRLPWSERTEDFQPKSWEMCRNDGMGKRRPHSLKA